jgi:hypothetical protein
VCRGVSERDKSVKRSSPGGQDYPGTLNDVIQERSEM